MSSRVKQISMQTIGLKGGDKDSGTVTARKEKKVSGQGASISSKRQNILVRNNWTKNYLQVVIFF